VEAIGLALLIIAIILITVTLGRTTVEKDEKVADIGPSS
jgi:hypothetical protein